MRAPVILVVAGATALHDQSLPALVKYLGHAGHELVASDALEEAYPHITGGQYRWLAGKTPRDSAGLVVEGRMEVPGSRGFVLQPPGRCPSAGSGPVSIGPRQLARQPQIDSLGLEQIMEVQRRWRRLFLVRRWFLQFIDRRISDSGARPVSQSEDLGWRSHNQDV